MSDQKVDMGVKNKFFDAKNQEPSRWASIERPQVYAGMLFLAVAMSVAYSCKCSKLEASMTEANDVLLEIGYKGIFTSLLDAIPVKNWIAKLVCATLLVTVSGVLLYRGCVRANVAIDRLDAEAIVPSASQTRRITERIELDAYEM